MGDTKKKRLKKWKGVLGRRIGPRRETLTRPPKEGFKTSSYQEEGF